MTAPATLTRPAPTSLALVRLEGRRMLRHPAPWLTLPLAIWWAASTFDDAWSGASYTGLLPALTPLLLGISLASMSTFARELVPVADAAPVSFALRSAARLLAGLVLVALMAVVVAAGAIWLRVRGGLDLGDEPGRTLHAHYTLPELVQPVLLAAVAVAAGAAAVHVLRSRLTAAIVLVIGWFLAGTYWLFQGPVVRYFALVQPQPISVEVGLWNADPAGFPATWLLSAPGEYQDYWARLVVSPAVAGWHDAYLVGVTAVLVGIAVPGRLRAPMLAAGVVLAGVAVFMQSVVAP